MITHWTQHTITKWAFCAIFIMPLGIALFYSTNQDTRPVQALTDTFDCTTNAYFTDIYFFGMA